MRQVSRATFFLFFGITGTVVGGYLGFIFSFFYLRAAENSLQNQPLILPVTRDTWFSNVGKEADCNLGGSSRLKLKSFQEMSLVDIDPSALQGRVILEAALHLHLAGDQPLRRVTVSSFGANWQEGTSATYAPQIGSSSFNNRHHPDIPWTVSGSDLCSVILGEGGTLWRMADASPADSQGWQQVPVDPALVAARIAGVSYGFLLFDDTGSEWTRKGEKFTQALFPNRFIFSHDSNHANAPYMTVLLGPVDKKPPGAPKDLNSEVRNLPSGEAWVSWLTPEDQGAAGVVGFFVKVNGNEVPRYLIPLAGKAGEPVHMHIRDLGLAPGAEVTLEVQAVDGAGNKGPAAKSKIRVSNKAPFILPEAPLKPYQGNAPLPRLGNVEVAVIDELDKVQPVTGELIPSQGGDYLAANHLWTAKTKTVRLQGARNEFVAFQIFLRGPLMDIHPTLTFEGINGSKLLATFGRYQYVHSAKGPLPDPIVPLANSLETSPHEENIPGQKNASLYCEVYIPHYVQPGLIKGQLTLKAGTEWLVLDVGLQVWNFTLPDYLSFLPEMNCYGLPENEKDFYRMAHRHRTVLNRLPYNQNGTIQEGCAPLWDGHKLDWSAWDRRFGPFLDGSAFADLPRHGVPLDCFYLPLHENWPDPMEGNYNGSYWADHAFPPAYRQDFVEVSRQIARHFNDRSWNATFFQCLFNGKNNFKARGWSHGSSPWLLDEPANFQDFWALRYFGTAFHEGIAKEPGKAKLLFRCDISRPQWQRDSLDGLLNYLVVSSAMRPYHRLVFDRKEAQGQLVIEYGSCNPIEEANIQPVAWCLDSWGLGSDGVLPWQTLGIANSWKQADSLALFYPPRNSKEGPIPSVRLKAYRRGQQDVEYLTLMAQVQDQPRWAVGQSVRSLLKLTGERKETGFKEGEDAGLIQYSQLRPQDLWDVRLRVGKTLSGASPAPKRQLIELRTPYPGQDQP